MKLKLPQVTLLGIDCVNVERLKIALDICVKDIEFGSVKFLTSLPTNDSRLVKIPQISSVEEFSSFCIKELDKYVETEYVLLVQYDGFILNPESWTDEFLKYDYIGAPLSWGEGKWLVGNGGFCLRSKKFLEISSRLASEGKIELMHPEDKALCVWYREILEKEGIKFAPADLGMKFSVVEDHGVYGKPFGFHGLFNKNMDTLINKYPDFPVYFFLPRRRVKLLQKIKQVFVEIALEGQILKSNVENDNDINVQISFKDEDILKVLESRSEYYAKIGEIVSIFESSENRPINGMKSFVVYKTRVGLIKVNFYLCLQSTSFKIENYKKISLF